jgi:metal-sulfur cluster biosynthetic enzyme
MAEQQTAPLNEEQVIDALRECYDPEIPVNLVDLGLIYDVA